KKGPIKILGISSGKRAESECAREDPVSLFYLKEALKHAENLGAKTQLIDLRDLKIGACKECYSTCPAQCRFNEKTNQCDCYYSTSDHLFIDDNTAVPIEKAYDMLTKEEFFRTYHDEGSFSRKDDMHIVYKAMLEADAIIFATSTSYYSRPALLQNVISRLCALDGGVEKLWGDGKNLNNSVAYAKKHNAKYKQRLYGKFVAFINCSKEGDSVTPDLMKACTMMGMKTIPLSVAYRVNWYDDPTHRSDTKKSKEDKFTLSLVKHIGTELVSEIKNSKRKYGAYSKIV
ncbi:MAG: NAD(P)H-dependent oxidoreductase, partial [Candidatus Woesearchaeota archaeon]